MRAVIQRVRRAEVRVNGHAVGTVGTGMLVLLGIGKEDTREAAESLADKIVNLRILSASDSAASRVSSLPIPSSTSIPAPMAPTACPLTRTSALFTLWMTARMAMFSFHSNMQIFPCVCQNAPQAEVHFKM